VLTLAASPSSRVGTERDEASTKERARAEAAAAEARAAAEEAPSELRESFFDSVSTGLKDMTSAAARALGGGGGAAQGSDGAETSSPFYTPDDQNAPERAPSRSPHRRRRRKPGDSRDDSMEC